MSTQVAATSKRQGPILSIDTMMLRLHQFENFASTAVVPSKGSGEHGQVPRYGSSTPLNHTQSSGKQRLQDSTLLDLLQRRSTIPLSFTELARLSTPHQRVTQRHDKESLVACRVEAQLRRLEGRMDCLIHKIGGLRRGSGSLGEALNCR